MSETDTTRRKRTTRNRSGITWISGFVSLFGLWLILTVFVETLDLAVLTLNFGAATDAMLYNNVVVGLGILLVAGYNFYRLATGYDSSVGAMGLVSLLGLWMVVVPFLVEVEASDAYWSNVVSGIVVALGAGLAVYVGQQRRAGTAMGV
jgi:hypothetical protein